MTHSDELTHRIWLKLQRLRQL